MTEAPCKHPRSPIFSTEHKAFSISTRIWATSVFGVVNSSWNCLHNSQWQALPLICAPLNWVLFMCISNTVGQDIQQKWHRVLSHKCAPADIPNVKANRYKWFLTFPSCWVGKHPSDSLKYSGKEYLIALPLRFSLLQYCKNIFWILLFAVLNCLQLSIAACKTLTILILNLIIGLCAYTGKIAITFPDNCCSDFLPVLN